MLKVVRETTYNILRRSQNLRGHLSSCYHTIVVSFIKMISKLWGESAPSSSFPMTAASVPSSASITKGGDLYLSPCDFTSPLFPKDKPTAWASCNDAYSYTWTSDFKGEISGLDKLSKSKLINSMGFCPQNRCQLYNVSSGGNDGICPKGLCYTKVENGGPSYGACCFSSGGLFNEGKLIGFYNKTQPTPKPIYKQSRVVLGQPLRRSVGTTQPPLDESFDSFINANQIYPGLIATQCPLAQRPGGTENTVDDVKRMIIENDIRMWVQLAPDKWDKYLSRGDVSPRTYTPGSGSCGVFPLEFFMMGDKNSTYNQGVSNFQIVTNLAELEKGKVPFVEMRYTLTAHVRSMADGSVQTIFDDNNPLFSSSTAATTATALVPSTTVTMENIDDNNNVDGSLSERLESVDAAEGSIILTSSTPISTHPVTVPGAWRKVSVTVKHFWYHQWKDFGIPPPEDETAIRMLARTAADIVKSGTSSVAVNCLSGRGRSGTFSAIILGEMLKVKSHTELVDVIVGMRENRDGMVETPAQLRFAARVLGLPDTADCGVFCVSEKTLDKAMQSNPYAAFFIGMLVVFLVQLCCFVCRSKSISTCGMDRDGHRGHKRLGGQRTKYLATDSSSMEDRSPYSSDADSCACPLTSGLYNHESTSSGESSSINAGASGRLQNRAGSREKVAPVMMRSSDREYPTNNHHTPHSLEMAVPSNNSDNSDQLEMSLVTAALAATSAVVAGVARAAKSK